MTSLRFWLVAGTLVIGLPAVGVSPVLAALAAAPFAAMAGWSLFPSRHTCGWCGNHFSGPYEWCCPDCEAES